MVIPPEMNGNRGITSVPLLVNEVMYKPESMEESLNEMVIEEFKLGLSEAYVPARFLAASAAA